jgi:hypothetical protein
MLYLPVAPPTRLLRMAWSGGKPITGNHASPVCQVGDLTVAKVMPVLPIQRNQAPNLER